MVMQIRCYCIMNIKIKIVLIGLAVSNFFLIWIVCSDTLKKGTISILFSFYPLKDHLELTQCYLEFIAKKIE